MYDKLKTRVNSIDKAKGFFEFPWAPKESRQHLMDIDVDNLKAFLEDSPLKIVNK